LIKVGPRWKPDCESTPSPSQKLSMTDAKSLLRSNIPIFCLGFAVLTTNVLLPTLVGMYVDVFGLPVGQAGYTAASYLFGAGAGSVLVGALVLGVPTRTLLLIGLSLLAVGNLLSIFIPTLWGILTIRFIAGIGEGIGFGLVGAFIARLSNPGRVYGAFVVVIQVLGACTLALLPWVRHEFGPRMILLPVAVAPLCLLAILKRFPELRSTLREQTALKGPVVHPLAGRLWLAPLATFVLYVAYGGVFTYIERLGVFTGINIDSVARLLAIGALLALGGGVLATIWAGPRAMSLKIGGALLIMTTASWCLVSGRSDLYVTGMMLAFLVWAFFAANLMTLPLLVDRSGRLGAASMGAMQWGMAAGPAAAGAFVDEKNVAVIGLTATVGFCVGLLLLLPVIRQVRANSTHSLAAGAPPSASRAA
jgi:predicted MFS family arabinose efflux permease